MTIEAVLKEALYNILSSVEAPGLNVLRADSDLFCNLDSLSIVDMLLEAEMLLEAATGRYVTLADETIFDASRSPLRSWTSWVSYVEGKYDC